MADAMYKFWDDTELWGDIYDDQAVFSLGAQLTSGKWKYRMGYGYADDPTDTSVSPPVGGLTQVNSNVGVIPLSEPVIQYLQATQAEVIYKHRFTLGVGYSGFLMPSLDLDLGAGWQFEESRNYGGHTQADTSSWHAGFGLTWHFD